VSYMENIPVSASRRSIFPIPPTRAAFHPAPPGLEKIITKKPCSRLTGV